MPHILVAATLQREWAATQCERAANMLEIDEIAMRWDLVDKRNIGKSQGQIG
jgi:hypothetical protein